MDDLHDIDKLFHDSLEPQEQPPSEKVWTEINKQLDKEDGKKPLLGYWVKTGCVIAVLLLVLWGYLSYNHQPTNNNINNKTTDHKSQNYNSIEKDSANVKLTVNNKRITQKNNIIPINKDKDANEKQKFETTNKLNIVIKSTNKKSSTTVNQNSSSADVSSTLNKKEKDKSSLLKQNNSDIKHKARNNNQAKEKYKLERILNIEKLVKNDHNNATENNKSTINSNSTKNIDDNILNKENEFESWRLLIANNLIRENIYTIHQPFLISNLLQVKATTEAPPLLPNSKTNGFKITTLKKPNNQTSRFYISAFAAPEWNGYQLQDDDDHGNRGSGRRDDDDKKSIEGREDEDASFTFGVNIGYQLNKKLALETGLHIGSYKISTDSVKIYAENNAGSVAYKLNTSSGYSYLNGTSATTAGDSTTAQHIKQAVNYIGIPFLLRYKLGNGKLSFKPAAGVMFNFITSTKISADLDGASGNAQSSGKLLGLKKMSMALIFNPSIYYQISNHISLGLEPYFNYNISPITKANVVDSYPYGIGLGAGIKYHF